MKKATSFFALLGIISLLSSCPTPETTTASTVFHAADFINFPVGSGIKYHVTDEYEDLDEDIWVVSQELPENNSQGMETVVSLVQVESDAITYRDSILGAKYHKPTSTLECFGFNIGIPLGNQAYFYQYFFKLKKLMILDEQYEIPQNNASYTVADGGSVTVNGTSFENCLRINLVVDDPDSAYLSGSGYAIFAPGTGLVKLEFTRIESSEEYSGTTVTYEYLEQDNFEPHSISGTVIPDGTTAAEDYYVQISTFIMDYTSVTDEQGNFTLEDIYGPDIHLFIAKQNSEYNELLDWDTRKETHIYNVTDNITGLEIDLSELGQY